MKPIATWGFTAPHSDIDLNRIVREAGQGPGPCPKAILLKIGDNTYTLARRRHVRAAGIEINGCISYGAITTETKVVGSSMLEVSFKGLDNSAPSLAIYPRDPGLDVLVLAGNLVKQIVGGVAVCVEVF